MATPDDAIWEMHALLHELLGSIKAVKERVISVEAEQKKTSESFGKIGELKESAESARRQRETIFEKLDALELLCAETKASLPNPTKDESLVAGFTTKHLLILLGFLGIALGLFTLDDIKSLIIPGG
jgi:hypothetical protein